MLKSMTGFGKAICETPTKKITIEIKSLNSKQFDAQVKIPPFYKEKEMELRNLLNQQLQRGKIELVMRIDSDDTEKSTMINQTVIQNYFNQLKSINQNIGIEPEDNRLLSVIMRLPDVLKTEQPELNEAEWKQIVESVKQALLAINQYRATEGKALEKDISKRVNNIDQLLLEIKPFEKKRIETVKTRIKQNLDELNLSDTADANRFEQELVYYIEKLDITEEKVRLKNHCKYFLETLEESVANGRKLAFISQEMGREINTIGSKANHTEIQKIVVRMKDELEKIKEQLLNIL